MKNFEIILQNRNNNGDVNSPDFNVSSDIADDRVPLPDDFRQIIGDTSPRNNRVDISFTIQTGLYNLGFNRGISACDVKPNVERETKLREHARAIAEDACRENFNIDESLHDRTRHEEFEKCREEIIEAKEALLNEKSKLKGTESIAVKAKAQVPPTPEFPIAIVVVAIPLITLTVAFALYDSFIASLGFILALTFSLMAGLCWGAFIAYLLLHNYNSDETERGWKNWFGLIAGIGMAIALGFIRLSQSSWEFRWLVIGLTLLEIFIVIGLDFFAQAYRQSLGEYHRKLMLGNEAGGEVEATTAEIKRRQDRVNELQSNIDDHLFYLDERELRAKQRTQFIESAEKAVIDGYYAAIAKNKGIHLK